MRQAAFIFVIVAAWDWTATASVRYIANGDLTAVPLAAVLTAFWWVSVSNVKKDWRSGLIAAIASSVGTLAGLYIP